MVRGPLRRAVLAGGAAVLALAARAAAAPSAPPADSDAGLITLCAGLDALQWRLHQLFDETWGVMTDAELGAADAAAYQIDLEQRRLLDRVCTLTPTTLGGCAALARSVALMRPDLVRAGPHSDPDVRLVAVLVRGLAGRA